MTFFWIGALILFKWFWKLAFALSNRTAADWILVFRDGSDEWLWKMDSLWRSWCLLEVMVIACFNCCSVVYSSFFLRTYCVLMVEDIWVLNLERKPDWLKFDSRVEWGYSCFALFLCMISVGRCFLAAVMLRLLALSLLWWALSSWGYIIFTSSSLL